MILSSTETKRSQTGGNLHRLPQHGVVRGRPLLEGVPAHGVLVQREGQQRPGRQDHIGEVHDEFALLAAQIGHGADAPAAAAGRQGLTRVHVAT